MTSFDQVNQVKDKVAADLFKIANVNEVRVDKKIVGGKETENWSISVGVDSKIPEEKLAPEQRIPSQIEGVPVDVVERKNTFLESFNLNNIVNSDDKEEEEEKEEQPKPESNIVTLVENVSLAEKKKINLVGGMPIGLQGNKKEVYGTLGYFISKGKSIYALSNAHVMEANGKTVIADPMNGGPKIGRVTFVKFGDSFDFAIAKIDDEFVPKKFEIKEIGHVSQVMSKAEVMNGEKVQFYGAVSGKSKIGSILATNHTVRVSGHQFTGVIRTSIVVKPGDSGSLLVTQDTPIKAIGLIFAGDADASYAIYMVDILQKVNGSLP